jgi:hypothetical protein
MRKLPGLIGTIGLAGVGLVFAASTPQQPASTPVAAKAQGVAPTPAQATPPANDPKTSEFTPEQRAVAEAVEAFSKAYNAADVKAMGAYFTPMTWS